MRRKSIVAFMLFSILLSSISLFGCGNTPRNRTNFTRLDTTDGTKNGINNPMDGNGGNSANLQDGTNGNGSNSTNLQDGTKGNGNRTNTGGSSTGANGTGTNNTGNTDGTNNNNISNSAKDGMQSATNAMKYGAANLKNDISNAGHKLVEAPNSKVDYFKGNETDYQLGGDKVRIYEYNSVGDLDADVNRISPDGFTINGTKANYTENNKPYYYRKGNSLIVYEGKEPAYIDEFQKLYGNPLR